MTWKRHHLCLRVEVNVEERLLRSESSEETASEKAAQHACNIFDEEETIFDYIKKQGMFPLGLTSGSIS